MYQQKQKELLKQYEKQEKKLKELKAGGKSTKQAVSTWGLPWIRRSFQEDELAQYTNLYLRDYCKGVGFCLSHFSAGKANKGSPDSEAAEVPPEEPG